MRKSRLLVIVGPTASGKSDLALKIAQEFNGEIIAADSRTIYKGMDIGTAKPSKEEQKLVPHWGLDLIEPGEVFSAYQFKKYAESKIEDIQKRGKLPILVGGTGLYVDSVIFDFEFPESPDIHRRKELEQLSAKQLQSIIEQEKYQMPENSQNKRHLIRTVERKGLIGGKGSLKDNTLIVGLMPTDNVLRKRIAQRAEKMFSAGTIKETEQLLDKYGEKALLKSAGIIYKICLDMIKNKFSKEEAIALFKAADWQYARRQRTWFKRNKFINWFENADEASISVKQQLNN